MSTYSTGTSTCAVRNRACVSRRKEGLAGMEAVVARAAVEGLGLAHDRHVAHVHPGSVTCQGTNHVLVGKLCGSARQPIGKMLQDSSFI